MPSARLLESRGGAQGWADSDVTRETVVAAWQDALMPFTRRELEATEAVVGFYAQMMPHVERGELVPGSVQSDIRLIASGLTQGDMVGGSIKACDVAIKTLAKVTNRSLTRTGQEIGEILDRIQGADVLGYGSRAYDDGKRCAVIMTQAMDGNGRGDFSEVFDANDPDIGHHMVLTWGALLVALILMLGLLHGISASEATKRLALDIQTITPTE